MNYINGSDYRGLINGEEVKHEKSFTFDSSSIAITLIGNIDDYNYWLNREGEMVEFSITNTDIKTNIRISNVILNCQADEAIEVIIQLNGTV